MTTFKVKGGIKLKGDLHPQGAKNEALQVLCAVLLTPEEVIMENVPNISDVNILIDLLRDLNIRVKQIDETTYSFRADKVDINYLSSDSYKSKSSRIRGSIMIVGPLLARYGKGYIPRPGGDKIGRRRLDTHFIGFENIGAKFVYDSK
jgi:UDP-N-acetylglucosamine 1-carboxyvinyltransferase